MGSNLCRVHKGPKWPLLHNCCVRLKYLPRTNSFSSCFSSCLGQKLMCSHASYGEMDCCGKIKKPNPQQKIMKRKLRLLHVLEVLLGEFLSDSFRNAVSKTVLHRLNVSTLGSSSASCHGNVKVMSARWAEVNDYDTYHWRCLAPNSKFTTVTTCM